MRSTRIEPARQAAIGPAAIGLSAIGPSRRVAMALVLDVAVAPALQAMGAVATNAPAASLWLACAVIAGAALFSPDVRADDGSTVNLGTAVPKAKDIDEGLFPDDTCEDLKAHGFKCMGFKPAVRFVLPSSEFKLGSAELPDAVRRQLDVFGQVLKSKSGASRQVRIEGHADASGAADANSRLSERRAEAARDYLVSKGVSADLLVPVGMGSKEPADPANPLSAKNRRVVIGRNAAPESPAPR